MHKKHPQTVIRLRMFWYTEYIGGKYLVPLVKGDSPIRGNVRNADKGVAVSGEEDVTAYAVTGGFRRATRDRVLQARGSSRTPTPATLVLSGRFAVPPRTILRQRPLRLIEFFII